MTDKCFKRSKDFFDCNLLLREVHDYSVGKNLLIYFVCIVKRVIVDNFSVDFFIPVDDMLHVAGEGNVNNVFSLEKLVCSDMNKACCLSDTLLGNNYSKIALSKSAVYGIFENPEWANAIKLL